MNEQIFYIDPQSYSNLSRYDSGVLQNMPDNKVAFYGSSMWDTSSLRNAKMNLIFTYNKHKNPAIKSISYLSSIFRIASNIIRIKPKVVHIQWLRLFPIDWLFLKFLKLRGIKVIFTAHNVLPHDSGTKFESKYRQYYQKVDRIIVHSPITKGELINKFEINADKIKVIPHGPLDIYNNEDNVKQRIEQLRKQYALEGKIVFCSLGIQSPYKGTDLLINAWLGNTKLKDNHSCHLFIVGRNDGIDYSRIKDINNVTVLDERVSDLDFTSFLRLSSVALFPYRTISQSGALFTAIQNRTPVLVSDAGGLTDPLSYAKVGWCLGHASADNIAKWLCNLVANPDELYIVQKDTDAFDTVNKIYSWDHISDMTLDLYNSLL